MKNQLLLGEFIALLSKAAPTADVYFDFGGFKPRGLNSYRGYYEHLAISFTDDGIHKMKVGDLLALCKDAIGITFDGYKGGSYMMRESTALWADNWGKANGTAIVGLIDKEWCVIIETAFIE